MLDVDNPSPALQRVPMDRMSHIFGWFQRMQTGSKPALPSPMRDAVPKAKPAPTQEPKSEHTKPEPEYTKPETQPPKDTKDPKGQTPSAPSPPPTAEEKPPEDYTKLLQKYTDGTVPNGGLVNIYPGTLKPEEKAELARSFWNEIRNLLGLKAGAPWSAYYDGMAKSAVKGLTDVFVEHVACGWYFKGGPTKTAVHNQMKTMRNWRH